MLREQDTSGLGRLMGVSAVGRKGALGGRGRVKEHVLRASSEQEYVEWALCIKENIAAAASRDATARDAAASLPTGFEYRC